MKEITELIAEIPGAIYLGAASLASGAYVGYCDTNNVPLPPTARSALLCTPAAVQGGIAGGLTFLLGISCVSRATPAEVASTTLKYGSGGALLGSLETALGYGLGYATGHLMR
ncbi:hypothetical protein HY639_03765 [Candidatus Woesearchaeota archaeon]|nr:hypothetical protein [Candidatus Woesearchaeota archaeon]